MGRRLPEVVADDEHLEGVVGDGQLQEGARIVFASGVGVLEQDGDGDVDGLGARVDEGDHLLAGGLALSVVVDVGLVVGKEMKHRLVGDEIICDMRLRLLVLEQRHARIGDGAGKALDVLRVWLKLGVNENAKQSHYYTSIQLCSVNDLGLMSTTLHPRPFPTPSTFLDAI